MTPIYKVGEGTQGGRGQAAMLPSAQLRPRSPRTEQMAGRGCRCEMNPLLLTLGGRYAEAWTAS